MSASRFASFLLVCACFCIPMSAQMPPEKKPFTAEQQEWLKEAKKWGAETAKFRKEGKLEDAIAAAEKMLAAEVKVHGELHDEPIGSLGQIAACREQLGQLDVARGVRERILKLQTKRFGKEHWQVTDAHVALRSLDALGKLDAAGRRELAAIEIENQRAIAEVKRGNYPKALAALETVLRTRAKWLGEEHADVARSLTNLGVVQSHLGRNDLAEGLLMRSKAVYKAVYGTQHPLYLAAVRNLADSHETTGQDEKWIAELMEAVELGPKFDANTVQLRDELESLGRAYLRTDQFGLAEAALRRQKTALGPLDARNAWQGRDVDLAIADVKAVAAITPAGRRELLAVERSEGDIETALQSGDFTKAIATADKGLKIVRDALGRESTRSYSLLKYKAIAYYKPGLYAKCLPVYEEILVLSEKLHGIRHPNYANDLHNFGGAHLGLSRFAAAERLYQRAYDLRIELLGPAHPETVGVLNNLALISKELADFATAERRYLAALDWYRKGNANPESVALTLNNLGDVYSESSRYDQADRVFREAKALLESAGRTRTNIYGLVLNNLGVLLGRQGDTDAEIQLLGQAIAVYEQLGLKTHPYYLNFQNNLGTAYSLRGEFVRSEQLFVRMRARSAELWGKETPQYALLLGNLAEAYMGQEKYAAAAEVMEEARTKTAAVLGESHPAYFRTVNNLGGAYLWLPDKLDRARANFATASAAYERTGRTDTLEAAKTQSNLAVVGRLRGDHATTAAHARKALAYTTVVRTKFAAVQTEHAQLLATESMRFFLDSFLSLALDASTYQAEAYDHTLAAKGAVFLRGRGNRQLLRLRAAATPDLKELFDRYDAVTRELATLNTRLDVNPDAGMSAQVEELAASREGLDRQLADRSTEFQLAAATPATAAQIAAALPADACFLDFLTFKRDSVRNGKLFADQWLLVFVVRRGHPVVVVDLGPLESIEAAVDAWREGINRRSPSGGDADPAQVLRRRLLEPIRKYLEPAKLVLYSPDGALGRLPFAALPSLDGKRFLIEDCSVVAVTAPQLLTEYAAAPAFANTAGLLLVGGVDFDAPASTTVGTARSVAATGKARPAWAGLPGTAVEAKEIAAAFRVSRGVDARTLDAGTATEEAVRAAVPSYRYLHFATHGFFAPPTVRRARLPGSHTSMSLTPPNLGERLRGTHPGLMSGLVLCGANRRLLPIGDDGILTALEVESLDLRQVDLAVLSACETGLGPSAGGEGVLGLQRAFQMAGARTTITTLWQIPDAATQKLMTRFYGNLWQKKMGKLAALREAQLWMLREGVSDPGVKRGLVRDPKDVADPKVADDGRLPPFYWAAFSLAGDWR